jgi:hypothetical protein
MQYGATVSVFGIRLIHIEKQNLASKDTGSGLRGAGPLNVFGLRATGLGPG